MAGFSKKRPTTFRVNTIKSSKEEIIKQLQDNNVNFEEFKDIPNSFIIKDEQINIEEFDIYKNGKIYVQSLSSMLPPIILEPEEERDILDMAAAPGGKTTQIASLSENKAFIRKRKRN